MKGYLIFLGLVVLAVPVPRAAGALGGEPAPTTPAVTMKDAIDNWIESEAIPFDHDDSESFNSAVDRFAAALGASPANGVGDPEPGSIEARFAERPGPGLFIPTHRGRSLLPEPGEIPPPAAPGREK
ncbi:MAG: hypothetical protein P9M08_03215 [Candidatus Erginobacter occultus]|nr:hypothetical protein [Candidatus Erginobacter occultus]